MKYTEEIKKQILELNSMGNSSRSIAGFLGISKSGINDFLFREKQEIHAVHNFDGPKILFLDLETAAALVMCFGRHKQFINQDAVIKEGGWIICGGYRWMQDDKSSVIYNKEQIRAGNDYEVCSELWQLFAKADAVVAHNLKNFDLKMLETRCLANGLPPLPNVQLIDTLEIAKKKFRFPSNKLDSLAAFLGIGRKVSHEGILLWVKVQQGDEQALETMLVYCEQDVDLLVEVFQALASRGLVSGFNAAMYYSDNKVRCHICGSDNVEHSGRNVYTVVSQFAETRCNDCGAVARTRVNTLSIEKRKQLLTSPKA